MKTKAWLLLAVMAFCSTATARPASGKAAGRVTPPNLATTGASCRERGTNLSAIDLIGGNPFGFPAKTAASQRPDRVMPLLRALDPPSDDDGQVDDNSSPDTDASLALTEQNYHPAEWRLIRSDSQFTNSFINSKSKPPP